MSDSKTSPTNGATKRNLPSWMSSRENANKSHGKKKAQVDVGNEDNEDKALKQSKGQAGSTASEEIKSSKKSAALSSPDFSKLLDGVVFVLSGFVNPERGKLRSQALEMGAEYKPDWNSGCTLLVCAFPNTPKFRQVEADCGTIVSKEWISECYTQKKLVDIDSYLMHAGKPWRRSNVSHEASHNNINPELASPTRPQKQVESKSNSKRTATASSKRGAPNPVKEHFSPSKVKKWVIDDLNKTISWLDSQEEKPEPSEIKNIAAEGILTCLQDAIDSLEQKQAIQQVIEQWNFLPRVVEELAKLDGTINGPTSLSKVDLHSQALACKRIYEEELQNVNDSSGREKKPKSGECEIGSRAGTEDITSEVVGYDSDETIEMTEEEIDLAYKTIASKGSRC